MCRKCDKGANTLSDKIADCRNGFLKSTGAAYSVVGFPTAFHAYLDKGGFQFPELRCRAPIDQAAVGENGEAEEVAVGGESPQQVHEIGP